MSMNSSRHILTGVWSFILSGETGKHGAFCWQ